MTTLNRTSVRSALIAIVSLCTTGWSAEHQPPRTAADGLHCLEQVLGKFTSKNARQFRIRLEKDVTESPQPGEAKVRVVSSGLTILGTPCQYGSAVAFDIVETLQRTVTAVEGERQGEVVRRQQRYSTMRYALRPLENGQWEFDATIVAHSIPTVVGRPYMTGEAKWMPGGLALIGMGTDDRYTADGELERLAFIGKINFVREGDDLTIDDSWQSYQRMIGPYEFLLPSPDLSKPAGEPQSWMAGRAQRE